MGMFDTLRFHENCAPTCADGHTCKSFQSKDLDCKMATYYVHNNQVFSFVASEAKNNFGYDELHQEKDKLKLIRRDEAVPFPLEGTLRIYTHCGKCRPLLLAKKSWGGNISEEQVWLEFSLTVEAGEVKQLSRVSPSRDALRENLKTQGAQIIEDDHPIAAAHFYRLEHPDEL